MIVKYNIGIDVLARNSFCPEFFHEENLVRELRSDAVTGRTSFLDPVGKMSHKVKEEIAVWYTYHCKYSRDYGIGTFQKQIGTSITAHQ